MVYKIKTLKDGFDKIDEIDKKIDALFEENDLGEITKILKDRMLYITEINLLTGKDKLPAEFKARQEKIIKNATEMQKKVLALKEKIAKRIGIRKKLKAQNKNFAY